MKKTINEKQAINNISFQQAKTSEKENDHFFNISFMQDIINNEIENQFKRYFSLIPNTNLLQNTENNEQNFKTKEKNTPFLLKPQISIDKSKKWDIFSDEKSFDFKNDSNFLSKFFFNFYSNYIFFLFFISIFLFVKQR